MNQLIVSPAPHLRKPRFTSNVMADVLIGLAPAAIASVILYGFKALLLIVVCMASSVLFESLYQRLMKQPVTVNDLSACVTGMLLAFCLPPSLPLWMAIIGCFVSIVVVKQLFGGLGRNFANPAIVGRIVLMLSFSGPMSSYPPALDAVAGATPLSGGKYAGLFDLFVGKMGGSLGEVCKVALLIGGIYLLVRKVITITIPATYIGTVAVFVFLLSFFPALSKGAGAAFAAAGGEVAFHLLTGGLILGAFFMATDFVTSPTTEKGKAIYGVACGVITVLIRYYGNYPEGVSFAILFMNILTPAIDNFTRSKPLGGVTNNG